MKWVWKQEHGISGSSQRNQMEMLQTWSCYEDTDRLLWRFIREYLVKFATRYIQLLFLGIPRRLFNVLVVRDDLLRLKWCDS